jgi:hypothetical protein
MGPMRAPSGRCHMKLGCEVSLDFNHLGMLLGSYSSSICVLHVLDKKSWNSFCSSFKSCGGMGGRRDMVC